MGRYTFHSEKIPVAGRPREVISEETDINGQIYALTCLSVGNPHCVLICKEDVTPQLAKEIGPYIETNEIFPNRINVQFVRVIDRNNIRIEIWERGAGYTLSSGSSSCAAAIASNKLNLVETDVKVHMQGGIAEVNIESGNQVYLTGTVKPVFRGFFDPEFQKVIKNGSF
jgi:diaminopimelate epimerase